MVDAYSNIDQALRSLGRDALIDTFHRERISDEAMICIVREPQNLVMLAQVEPNGETRERILAAYQFILGGNSLGRGAGLARVRSHPPPSRPARNSEESMAQVAMAKANNFPRPKGA